MNPNQNISTLREIWKVSNEEHWLPVQGTSMQPLLHEGDSICISHNLSKVMKGDILVFQQEYILVAHRLVRIVKRKDNEIIYLTLGDNCAYFDPLRINKNILGRVVSIQRDGKVINLTAVGSRIWHNCIANWHLIRVNLFHSLRKLKQNFLK